MTEGIIYSATGEKHIQEAIRSAESMKEHMPNVETTLFSDRGVQTDVFDTVRLLDNPSYDFGDSVLREEMICYDRNIFLDTDIYVLDSIDEVFTILDHFDIAAAHNPHRNTSHKRRTKEYVAPVPDAFPQYNTGVIAYRDCSSIREFIQRWGKLYDQHTTETERYNQPTFRQTLYSSDVRVATLTPEYNLYFNYPSFVDGKVKILHGHSHTNISEIEKKVNKTYEARISSKSKYPIGITTRSDQESTIYKLRNLPNIASDRWSDLVDSIRKDGYLKTGTKVVSQFR